MIGLDWTQSVTLQQVVGLVFITAVLLLGLLLATWVYFGVRMKLLRNRVASLEFEMKVVAKTVGLIPKKEPEQADLKR